MTTFESESLDAEPQAGPLPPSLGRQAFQGLERSCDDGIRTAPPLPGIERMEAWFHGNAFELHRHDTYAVGVTLDGVQSFRYRGASRASLPGQVLVLHPDELHDGGAGTEEGLHYRILYLEPSLLMRGLGDGAVSLPFLRQPVFSDPALREDILALLGPLDRGLEELTADDLLARLAQGLARHAGQPLKPLGSLAWRQVDRVRDYLEAHALEAVRSEELEEIAGLDRYALSRHFRAAFATSPHRFLLMRRLGQARALIAAGESLAEVAAATGFADQSHLTRHFKKAYGVTPGRWAGLVEAGRRTGSAAA
ncbi:AraC family transcriptional regulator [Labrys sp. KNU-23]|nr:AraC family transcriptional regulator [Labrys sp. KNU-23]QEN89091.1 AraC family transcriptional regulator [Labrys sp. KNU-23]